MTTYHTPHATDGVPAPHDCELIDTRVEYKTSVCTMCHDTGRIGRDRDGIVIHCGCWYGLDLMVRSECADIQIYADWIVTYRARVKAGMTTMGDEAYAAIKQAYSHAIMMHDGLEAALLRLTE